MPRRPRPAVTPPTTGVLLGAAATLLVTAAPAGAQSAQEILETALDRYEARAEGIERYTVVQDAMGFETTVTFERAEVDGRTVFLPAGQAGEGPDAGGLAALQRLYPEMAEKATVAGETDIEGETCWILVVDDPVGMDLDLPMGEAGGEGEFVPESLSLAIDQGEYVVRRMEVEGEVRSEGEARPTKVRVELSDYRDVEGMLHPFRTRILVEGAVPGMSDEELAEARAGLEEMERQLEEMDESQRAMVERMMGPRMERLREMLAEGTMELEVVTKEVRVEP